MTCLSDRVLLFSLSLTLEREKKVEFLLGDGWVKSASVFACLFHIKKVFKLVRLSYTGKDKHSIYCADVSLSLCFSFSLPLRAVEDCTQTSRNKLGGLGTTHRAGSHLLFSPASPAIPNILVYGHSSFSIFVYFSCLLFFVPYISAQLHKLCMPTLSCFHLPSSNVFHFVCLNILM